MALNQGKGIAGQPLFIQWNFPFRISSEKNSSAPVFRRNRNQFQIHRIRLPFLHFTIHKGKKQHPPFGGCNLFCLIFRFHFLQQFLILLGGKV